MIRVSVLVVGLMVGPALAGVADPPLMPPGFKIVETARGPVMATAQGMTIYKQLPKGRAAKQVEVTGVCVFQCPSEWPPLLAPADAKPVGDFAIITNADGKRQWTYKNVPLETFAFDRKPGDTLGDDTHDFNGPRVPFGEAAWIESAAPVEKPAAAPAAPANLPPEVTVRGTTGNTRVFADMNGMTLYACDASCTEAWTPLAAGALARDAGDWTVLARADGTRQWAYKKQAVSTFTGDKKPGDVAGGARALVEYQAGLPRGVTVVQSDTGPVYAEKASGKTLYYQGYNHRAYQFLGFNGGPFSNCANACAEVMPPLLAAKDDKPVGEWWIFTRPDGARQWAYRGNPVYTYRDDEPGRHKASYMGRLWTEVIANVP
jgi:predicted lipoprotein with Yx(FWY)xxD motif